MEANSLSKVIVGEYKDFTVHLEIYEGMLFIHCDVIRFTKSVHKKMKSVLKAMQKKYRQPIYAEHIADDNKQGKFLDMYGFKYFGIVKDIHGDSREIFVKGSK